MTCHKLTIVVVFFEAVVYEFLHKLYLKQKPSTRQATSQTNLVMVYTHVTGATVGFAGHEAENSLIDQNRAGPEAQTNWLRVYDQPPGGPKQNKNVQILVDLGAFFL